MTSCRGPRDFRPVSINYQCRQQPCSSSYSSQPDHLHRRTCHQKVQQYMGPHTVRGFEKSMSWLWPSQCQTYYIILSLPTCRTFFSLKLQVIKVGGALEVSSHRDAERDSDPSHSLRAFLQAPFYSLKYCPHYMPFISKTIMVLENSALWLVNGQPSPWLRWQSETCCLPSPEQIGMFSDHNYNATSGHILLTQLSSRVMLSTSCLLQPIQGYSEHAQRQKPRHLHLGAIVTDPNPLEYLE